MVPSAGARHPLDTFLAIGKTKDLQPGMALSHQLTLIREPKDIMANLNDACVRKWIVNAPMAFIWVAAPYRATWRYSERGWRYIFIDAGHACQNLYLACEAIGAAG
jgi:SagB-type dehydrogenase family enzyme